MLCSKTHTLKGCCKWKCLPLRILVMIMFHYQPPTISTAQFDSLFICRHLKETQGWKNFHLSGRNLEQNHAHVEGPSRPIGERKRRRKEDRQRRDETRQATSLFNPQSFNSQSILDRMLINLCFNLLYETLILCQREAQDWNSFADSQTDRDL